MSITRTVQVTGALSMQLLWWDSAMQFQDLVRDYGRTLVEALVGCCFLAATYAAQRTKRWLIELLDRERQLSDERDIRRHNETLKTLSEASVSAERPTLESLLSDAERDFSLKAPQEPTPLPFRAPSRDSVPLDLTQVRKLPGPPVAASIPGWEDDEEITTVPETPDSKASLLRPSEPPR